ncbi:MAG TPA: DUF2723 domain-containing protein [Candidatus Kapabacteria bacterium]|nr:DUF2723 domain-containing protein [Candidatus Kapabacteria bacterium]
MKIFSRPLFGAIIVFVIAFIVYLQTMAPSVPFIDGGELATAVTTLGICHPTGYPLFTLIGWVFAHLPIASHVIVRLNIMSAFFTALGAGGMVYLVQELISNWFSLEPKAVQNPKKKSGEQSIITSSDAPYAVAIGILTGIATAFSGTWWAQSNSIEVYPIHCFMVPIVLTFFFRMLRLEKDSFGKNSILFAFVLGLLFSNHLTTVLLAPACIYMYFAISGFGSNGFKKIAMLAVPFIIGLLPYLYFPIRSSQFPIMDWGHPVDLKLFMKHFTGGQYKIWMFTAGAPSKNWPFFWHEFPTEFSVVGMLLVVVGLYALLINTASKKIHLLVFVILLFFGCLLYSINFDILEIAPYFLTAYLACLLLIAFGAAAIVDMIARRNVQMKIQVAFIIAIILGGAEIATSYHEVDESGNNMVEDYTMNMLNNLPPNAIIFSSAWDFWTSGAFYYQLVEKIRPDILVVDAAMLRDRPWYYPHFEQRAPGVMSRVKPEMDAFLKELRAFDRDEPFDAAAIGDRYKDFTEALVRKNLDRPIFVATEVMQQRDPLFAPSFKAIPCGVAFRLWERDTLFEMPLAKIQWRDEHYRDRSYYTDNSRVLQSVSYALRAQTLAQYGRLDEAKQWLDLALRLKPDLNAKLDDLQPRDKEFGYTTNEQFARFEQMRVALGK